ncbi:hypothetical protein SVAN01_03284 [Stagonosporopsis vannaccii]|nr:hypothetical protein SVAN01_03284 [Stagonosporopsis vannaccii]
MSISPPPAVWYSPLSFDSTDEIAEFRIATLLPGKWPDPIRCRLTVHSLHKPPPYRTISYAWGNPQDTASVFVGDAQLTVPSSLALCLRYLRSTEDQLDLWTDAICIDQTNLRERAQQVMQMGYIYWNCASMYIWLGEPGPVSESGNPFEMVLRWTADKHFYDYPGFSRSPDTGEWVFEDNPAYQKMYEVFRDFISRSWWTRLWCVQEIALCPQATVVMGKWQIPWATVLKAKANHGRHDTKCCAGIANQMPAKYTYFPDHMLFLSQRFDLTHMDQTVRSLRHKLCKDPRDKIYGLLGLLWTKPKAKFFPDYALPVGTLYTQYTREVVERSNGDLLFLTGSGLGSDCFQMPSWVRNFAAPLDTAEASHEHTRHKQYSFYNASAQTNSKAEVLENSTLSLSGFFVDRVKSMSIALRQRDWACILNAVQEWAEIAEISALELGIDLGSLQDCFWRTTMADIMPIGVSGLSPWRRITTLTNQSVSKWFADAKARMKEGHEPVLSASIHALWIASHGRCFFRTENGHLGLCFPHTRPGDEVWVLAGGKVPFVLRRPEAASLFVEEPTDVIQNLKMVGECYLHGFMDGEALTGDNKLLPVHLT